jgi:hypothetical protein
MIAGTTAVIGCGAQKSGTSWLFAYLAGLPEVTASRIKELHFFESWLEPQRFPDFNPWFVRALQSHLAADGQQALDKPVVRDLLDRVRAIDYPPGYLEHFRRLGADTRPLFLDITPSYALMSAESFRAIRTFLEAAGVHIKILFLMRDPVDRYFSALRMDERERNRQGETFSAAATFDRHLETPAYHERSRYDRTIARLLDVFPRQDVFFDFYETLFQEATIRRLTDFLGVEFRQPDFRRYRNVSAVTAPLTEAQVARGVRTFAPVYTDIRRRFAGDVPDSWRA